jgi:hypothetical protein
MNRYLYAPLVAAAFFAASAAFAAPTVYSTTAAFNAATTGVSTVNFEGTTSSTYILGGGSYAQPGFTITQNTNNAFLTDPTFTSYYYNWGTGDVINTPYNGVLTITFSAPVTAFAIDLGSFYDDQDPRTPCCAASTLYGKDVTIGTSQGNFLVDLNSTQTMKFFGVTSDTAFTSFTITGVGTDATASTVFDNVRFGSAAVAPVPEPATWAMMIVGFGMVGANIRRRQHKAKVTYA